MDVQKRIITGIDRLQGMEFMNDEEKNNLRKSVMTDWIDIENDIDTIGAYQVEEAFELVDPEDIRIRIFVLSWLHKLTADPIYIERLLSDALLSDLLPEELYFVFTQIQALFFSNPEYTITDRIEDLLDDMFKKTIEVYYHQVSDEIEWIPSSERNREFILVFTDQFLMAQHGPTKTTIDRCRILMENMGKDVLLINSGTCLCWDHVVILRDLFRGSYMEEYIEADHIDCDTIRIPYIQMENRLPTFVETKEMIRLVKENKPYQIVVIGGGFYEELLKDIVPVLNVSLSPSKLYRTFVDYQQLGRPVNDGDRRFLEHRGLPEDHIIVENFTSYIMPQSDTCSRKELGLPEDVRIAVVVGGRLTTEITEDYINMILPCLKRGLHLLLLGDVKRLIPRLKTWAGDEFDHIICPGMVDDPLMYLDHCYIYVNPHRMGGGTSCVEAMSKSIPVVTTKYGDVYVNTGEEFSVDDYDSMQKEILLQMEDVEYHQKKMKKAKERAELMLDSSSAFIRVMNEYEKRMLEKENGGKQ